MSTTFAPNPELTSGVLRAAEEGQASDFPAHVPPHGDAHDLLGCHQVLPWRPRKLHRHDQLLRAHRHVYVLPTGCLRPTLPEVPQVEAVHHYHAAG